MSVYSTEVLNDSPYLFCRMDDATIGTVADSSINGFTVTHQGAGVIVQEPPLTYEETINFSTNFYYTGSNSYALLSSTYTAGFPSSAVTFEAWFKVDPSRSTGVNGSIFSYGQLNVAPHLNLQLKSAANPEFWMNGVNAITTTVNVGNDVHHIALSWENTTGNVVMYLDGAIIASTSGFNVGYTVPASKNLYMGSNVWSNTTIGCWLDNLAVYPTVLSSSRIKAHYNVGVHPVVSSLNPVTSAPVAQSSPLFTATLDKGLRNIDGTLPTGPGVFEGKAAAVVKITSVTVLDSTTIRAHLSLPIKRNAALTSLTNYEVSPYLEVKAVTPENVVNPTYIDITLSEMKDGTTYSLYIHNPLDPA